MKSWRQYCYQDCISSYHWVTISTIWDQRTNISYEFEEMNTLLCFFCIIPSTKVAYKGNEQLSRSSCRVEGQLNVSFFNLSVCQWRKEQQWVKTKPLRDNFLWMWLSGNRHLKNSYAAFPVFWTRIFPPCFSDKNSNSAAEGRVRLGRQER